MTTEIRTLRVDAQLNDQYSTTAKKIEEANRGIGASGKTAADGLAGVGTAANDTVTKISRANDGIERLKRQLIAGYASSVDFERGLRTIATGLDKGKLSAEQASAAVEGLTRKFGLNANAAQFAERGQLEFARAIDQANAKIAANATASEKAIDAQRRLAQASNQNAYAANQNRPGAGSANTGNIVAQFQDIGITAAMGMSPMTIALQQGSQLSSVLAQSERPLQALMAGFAGLLSPISLVTVATVGLGAVAIQYFSASSEGAERTNGLLQAQADIIRQTAQNWGDALPSVKAYAESLDRAQKLSQGQEASNLVAGKALDGLGDQLEALNRQFIAANSSLKGIAADPAFIRDFGEAFGILRERLDAGSASMADVQRAQAELGQAMEIYGTKQVRSLGEAFDAVVLSIRRGVEEAKRAREEFYRSVSGGTNVQDIVAGASFTDASGKVRQTSTFTPTFGPTPQRRPLIELEGITAPKTSKNSFGEISKTLDRDIERQQLELSLIGKTTIEAEGLRKQFELIANLKAEAAKTGTAVDEKEIDLIKRKTDEYGRLAEQMGRSKMQFELGRQLSDSGLSSIDRRTVQTLRQYGQPEDLGSQQATDVRNIYRQMDAQEAAKGFLTSFQAELVASGGDVGDAFSKALKSSLSNLLTKMLDESLSNLGNALVGALFKGSGGAPSGGSGKGAGAGAAGIDTVVRQFDGSAPVTPVQRAPLGDVGAYAKAIQSIESGGNYGALGPITKTGDRAYGAYQVMGNNIGPWSKDALGRSISTQQFLASPALQDKIFEHRFGGYVDKFGPSGAAQAWFGGPGSVGKGGGWTDALGTSGNAYVEKFNESLKKATSGLGNLGEGLGKFGQSLGGAFPAAPAAGGGGGGLFSWLSGLSMGNPYAFSPQAKSLSHLAGTGVGFFADGTPSAPGGLAMVGERGRELVNLPRGSQVVPSHQTESLLARGGTRGSGNQNRPTVLNVVIQGASGDDHVRSLVNEGVQTALASHNENQRRTGFGATQNRFVSQRG